MLGEGYIIGRDRPACPGRYVGASTMMAAPKKLEALQWTSAANKNSWQMSCVYVYVRMCGMSAVY